MQPEKKKKDYSILLKIFIYYTFLSINSDLNSISHS